jgi:hypothetical protein
MLQRLKRLVVLVVAGFFAFAPPGTLIVGAALLFGLFGKVWLTIAATGLVTFATLWLVIKKSSARRCERKNR